MAKIVIEFTGLSSERLSFLQSDIREAIQASEWKPKQLSITSQEDISLEMKQEVS